MARWARRLGWGVASGVAIAGLTGLGWACLPNLTLNLCGDGYIDVANGETCDPKSNVNAGCNSVCQIQCDPPDGGAIFIGPASDHCYFTSKHTDTYANAAFYCESKQAHLVTLVDGDEVDGVHTFASYWPNGARYWVGLHNDAGNGAPFYSTVFLEPGWRSPTECSGCFAYQVTSTELPGVDGGADAEPNGSVVMTSLGSDNGEIEAIDPSARAEVVCEREPVGSRSVACQGDAWCFTVLATLSGVTPKNYAYFPLLDDADAAEARCHAIDKHGSLVVLGSRAEREQVIYELFQLSLLGVYFPGQFWIGLSSKLVSNDAGMAVDAEVQGTKGERLEWIWDDGKTPSLSSTGPRPAIWGNHQPGATTPTRAYINVPLNQETYDTGLAYAHDVPTTSTRELFPFVCQF